VSLTPQTLTNTHYGWVARIRGNGNKVAEVALSPSLAGRLSSFAYRHKIQPDERIFLVSTTRVGRLWIAHLMLPVSESLSM
jgi:hypothetical protein